MDDILSRTQARSLWVATSPETAYPSLDRDLTVDVAIVGGGIAGLSTAAILKKAGATVAVLEAGRVGTGVTGHTTGKLSSLHGLIYRRLARSFGDHGAFAYGQANEAAIAQTAALIESEQIDCDFERVVNYTYAESQGAVAMIEEEVEIAERLGLPASYESAPPLPFDVAGAIRFSGQAQLHAVKYLAGLARAVDGEGSHVFEQSRVEKVEDEKPCRVHIESGRVVRAGAVVIATNFPILDRGLHAVRCHPHRSYLVALELEEESPPGTFISADEPLRSLLSYGGGDRTLLLVGGEGHRASESVDSAERYERLASWSKARFAVGAPAYRWSTQDPVSLDGAPYVGRIGPLAKNVFVATAFSKWGLSNGTAAAMIISDEILGRENQWASVFDSNRFKPLASAGRFFGENLRVAKRLIGDRLTPRRASVPEVERGQGRVIDLRGEKVGVHRDQDGRLHQVSALCTHAGCVVEWNGSDETWDCPCHGSRFEGDGTVIQGPADKDLPPIETSG